MVEMRDKKHNKHCWKHVGSDVRACPCVAASCCDTTYLPHSQQLLGLSVFFMCFNAGFTPRWVFTLPKRCPAEEGSAMAVSSAFCSWAFAMISEKRYWGVLPWQHRMELRWIVALCQGLSLRVSRVCLLRVNHAYQLTVSL